MNANTTSGRPRGWEGKPAYKSIEVVTPKQRLFLICAWKRVARGTFSMKLSSTGKLLLRSLRRSSDRYVVLETPFERRKRRRKLIVTSIVSIDHPHSCRAQGFVSIAQLRLSQGWSHGNYTVAKAFGTSPPYPILARGRPNKAPW